MKSEILEKIAEIVSVECEVSVEDLKSVCKRTDIVEARSIFVHYCYVYGLSPSCIAAFLCRKRRSSISDYAYNYVCFNKQSYSFRQMSAQVEKKLSEIFPR